MKWLIDIFKPKIGATPTTKISMCRFGLIDTRTGEMSDGYITSNGKMAYRRVGKWTDVNNNKAAVV